MKWLDLPPIWLTGFLVAGWGIERWLPGLKMSLGLLRGLGGLLILIGMVLMVLAAFEMRRWRTTIIPHQQPSALVASGVFRFSRNPIYLGDALVLTGAILWWGQPLAIPLIPIFVWVITSRFIKPEEARLRAGFGDDFAEWREMTRRWL